VADVFDRVVIGAGIPTKTLRETALYVGGFRKRDIYGLSLKLDPQVALEKLMARKAEVVGLMTRAVERNLDKHGIRVIRGQARLTAERLVEVTAADGSGRQLQAPHVLVATGSHPVVPEPLHLQRPGREGVDGGAATAAALLPGRRDLEDGDGVPERGGHPADAGGHLHSDGLARLQRRQGAAASR
jgi:hypothetical protein